MASEKTKKQFLIIHHYFNAFLANIRRNPTLDLFMAEAYKKDLKTLENGYRLTLQEMPETADDAEFARMLEGVLSKFQDMKDELRVQIARVEFGGSLYNIRPARTTLEMQ